jgi:thymidylate synthase (FAD)
MTKSTVKYHNHTFSDKEIAQIARVSFDNFDNNGELVTNKKDFGLLGWLIIDGHTSPFRHPSISFIFEVSLDIFAQMSTHKIGVQMSDTAFNSKSYRYVSACEFDRVELREAVTNKKQGSGVVMDDKILDRMVTDSVASSYATYRNLIDIDIANETARRLLPQCTMTKVIATGTLNAWMNFVALRTAPNAQKEVRMVANQVNDILTPLYPMTMFWLHKLIAAQEKMRQALHAERKELLANYDNETWGIK